MMMIRSQDRKWLQSFTRGVYVRSDDSAKDYQVLLDNGDPAGNGDLPLGKYDSEVRCLEILNEIQEYFFYENPKVYEMPEK